MNNQIKRLADRHGLSIRNENVVWAGRYGLTVGLDGQPLSSDDKIIVAESTRIAGPRGHYYHFVVLLGDGSILAVGEEQGNYAGGIKSIAPHIQKTDIDAMPAACRSFIADSLAERPQNIGL